MAGLLRELLGYGWVGVTSGYTMAHFRKQVLGPLGTSTDLSTMFFAPQMGAEFYLLESAQGEWKRWSCGDLTTGEKQRIQHAISEVSRMTKIVSVGPVLDDRGCQIAYAALGMDASLEEKQRWDPDMAKRQVLKQHLEQRLPEFEVSIGGHTTITVWHKGMDKRLCLKWLKQVLGYNAKDVVYVANDFEGEDGCIRDAGAEGIPVAGPKDTKRVVRSWLEGLA